MSYSDQVKQELRTIVPKDTHCLRAELLALATV